MHSKIWILFVVGQVILNACTQESPPVETTPTKQTQWIAGWQEASSLSIPRAGAATVTHNGYMYVIGGVDGRQFVTLTEYAKINDDGSLSAWQRGPNLIEERGFIDAVVYNGYIYVVGGGNGPNGHNLLRSAERAKLKSDGSLGSWQKEASQMVMPRRCSKLVLTDNVIYSLGGFGGALLDSVEYATIQADGNLSEWKMTDNTLTIPRYVNSTKGASGNMYVLGGHDQSKGVGITDVEWSAKVDKPGSNVWQATSALNTGRYGLASAKHGKTIYALGGLTGLEYLDSVEVATISVSGELDAWRYSTALPEARATFNAVVYKNWIYVIGGTNQDHYLNSVAYASINDKGDIGFWGSAQQASEYQQSVEAKKTRVTKLPNEGVVAEILQASMYSYIRVTSDKGGLWLAGPKMELKTNDTISFSKGVSMSNFYSKELQRNFPVILFVSKIQKVN